MTALSALADEIAACRRCHLYKHATQAVPGRGPRRARMMLVGEQPGNDEDLAGRPFVGPAGRMLDQALENAGIDRAAVFVTNAVKHFKFTPRGKRRLHRRPNGEEIAACHIWYENERALVAPALVVALGATAARAVLGRVTTIKSVRGKVLEIEGGHALVTVHPSLLLRIPDAAGKRTETARLVRDLKAAEAYVRSRPDR